jgi:hypothetical protein
MVDIFALVVGLLWEVRTGIVSLEKGVREYLHSMYFLLWIELFCNVIMREVERRGYIYTFNNSRETHAFV